MTYHLAKIMYLLIVYLGSFCYSKINTNDNNQESIISLLY